MATAGAERLMPRLRDNGPPSQSPRTRPRATSAVASSRRLLLDEGDRRARPCRRYLRVRGPARRRRSAYSGAHAHAIIAVQRGLRLVEPVHAADPALAVRRVPLDRAQDAVLPRDHRLPARFAVQLLVADAERHHVGDAWTQPRRRRHDLPVVGPEAVLTADAEDQLDPVAPSRCSCPVRRRRRRREPRVRRR